MNRKLISLLVVCLLAACQRTPETRPAVQKDIAVATPQEDPDLEKALSRAVFGDANLAKGREVLGFKVLGHDRAALVISEIPPDSNAEAAAQSYDEYLAALGPRAQRKVKSAVRYSLSEKGINLVSGKNIEEVSYGE